MVYGKYNYSIHGAAEPTFTSRGGTILYGQDFTQLWDDPGRLFKIAKDRFFHLG